MWINNAQSGYSQTELLYKVVDAWQGDHNKMIWNISTMMTTTAGVPEIPGQSTLAMAEYKNQKRALEDAVRELQHKGIHMCLIRPGAVATQPYNEAGVNAAGVQQWVAAVCEFYISCRPHDLYPQELSLGFRPNTPML